MSGVPPARGMNHSREDWRCLDVHVLNSWKRCNGQEPEPSASKEKEEERPNSDLKDDTFLRRGRAARAERRLGKE